MVHRPAALQRTVRRHGGGAARPGPARSTRPGLRFPGRLYAHRVGERHLAFDGATSLFGYTGWTDNRDVRPGVDIRETDYLDGFDAFQCRTPTALKPDQCPNAHGLDQNIYGQSPTLPVG
jgi:hypothetical protein